MNTIIDLSRVTAKTTLGRSTVYAYVKAGKFPAPVRMGTRHVAWIAAEVDAWVEALIAASRADQAQEVLA